VIARDPAHAFDVPEELAFDAATAGDLLVDFIRRETRKAGFSRAVLGLSGGVDSAAAAFLATRALGPKNVLCASLPYRASSPESLRDARRLVRHLGARGVRIGITPMIDAYFARQRGASALRRGNKMARERMAILYDLSAREGAMVVGTSNKTELLLGYGTVFGDTRTRSDDTRAYADLEYQHTFKDKWVVDARAYYDWYWYNGFYIYDYAGTGVQPFTINHDYASGDWWGLDLSVSRSLLEKHRVTLGTEEILNTKQVQGNYDVQPYFRYLFDQRSSNISAVYLQDEFAIRKNLLLSAGVRFDHYSTFGGTLNPRAGLIYSPGENTTVKVLYGQAFRAPDDFELYYDAVGYEPCATTRNHQDHRAGLRKVLWQVHLAECFRLLQ